MKENSKIVEIFSVTLLMFSVIVIVAIGYMAYRSNIMSIAYILGGGSLIATVVVLFMAIYFKTKRKVGAEW